MTEPEDMSGLLAEVADGMQGLGEVVTGLRNALVAQGWSPDGAEEVTLMIAHRTFGCAE